MPVTHDDARGAPLAHGGVANGEIAPNRQKALDPATKWPRQGEPVAYVQQRVNHSHVRPRPIWL